MRGGFLIFFVTLFTPGAPCPVSIQRICRGHIVHSRLMVFLFAAYALIFTATGKLSGQPVVLFQNNLEAKFHFERDQVIAYTPTQIAVLRHGSTEWRYYDLPYNKDTPFTTTPDVYHASGDTILVVCFDRDAASVLRTTLFRSTNGGRTWDDFYRHDRSSLALYVSGHTILIDRNPRGSDPVTVVNDAGSILATATLNNYSGMSYYMTSADRRYALCRDIYYRTWRLSFEDDGHFVTSEPILCHGLMATLDGPIGFRLIGSHDDGKVYLFYRDRTDTIDRPPTFRNGGVTALFDAKIYLLGYNTIDGIGPDRWYMLRKQPLDPTASNTDVIFSVFDNPTVQGDTLFWGDHTRFRYVVHGSDSVHTVDGPDGWSKPAAVSWIDGALCYYMGREAITSYVPDFCDLLTVDPDAPLGAVVQSLPFTLDQTVFLGSKVVNGSNELRTAIKTDYPSYQRPVYDIDPVHGASLREEFTDGTYIPILAWHERNDTVWFCRRDPSSQETLLIMQLPNRYQRIVGSLQPPDRGTNTIISIDSYRGSIFLMCEIDGIPTLLKCTPRSWTTSPINKVLELPPRQNWNQRYRLVVMDSCLTVSGVRDETLYCTTYDGTTFNAPAFGDIVTQQGNTNIVLRGNRAEGRYNVHSTTSGMSLTALGTIYFHPDRTILGAYTVHGGVALVTDEGTWLLPLRPFVPTGVEDIMESPIARHTPTPASAVQLPYEMTFSPSPFIRHIDIYNVDGRLVSTETVPPGNSSIMLAGLPAGSYFICIPGQTGLDIRRFLME